MQPVQLLDWAAAPSDRGEKPESGAEDGPQWREGAGGLLLVAAAQATGLLPALERALVSCPQEANSRLAHLSSPSRRILWLTLLFLDAVGLHRTWDLCGYSGDALGVLTGRQRVYGDFHTERFLTQVAQAGGAEVLTNALGKWTTQLWHGSAESSAQVSVSPRFYVDGHRKPVYTDKLIVATST